MTVSDNPSASPKELLEEANGASVPASSAWLAFLFLLAYVVVTLAGVSHKALLLNSPVKLPIINADIPLVGFFQYAPAMLLLVYLSLLVQHVILARKYRKFTDAIAPYEIETGSQHPARERVQSYVFAQMLAGPAPNRITKFMMQLIVYVTFAIIPVITLLYFQIKFLPYHDVTITYWHRIAILLAFAMLILLIPIMQHVPPKRKWHIRVGPQEEAWEASATQVVLVVILLPLIVGFSWLIATVPDEWIDRRLGFVAPASVKVGAEDEAKLLNPLVRRLVYDRLTSNKDKWRRWLLSYRVLIVEDTDLGTEGDAKVVLRERNFRFALLNRSDLQRADLVWADLRAAQLWKTLAKGKLNDAQLQGAYLQEAQLQGAKLTSAALQGADLAKAQLQGAELNYAKLQGAGLRGVQLQGADLTGAALEGADLRGAQLQGANLEGAKFQGADLGKAGIWLTTFPRDLSGQSPAPLDVAGLDMSPLTPEAKAQLRQDLDANITDASLLAMVKSRLDDILRDEPPGWDETRWAGFAGTARDPSAAELARFHAGLACVEADESTEDHPAAPAIASRMATRALESATEPFGKAYAKAFAAALLDEGCEGGRALTRETHAALKDFVAAQE
jgi:uncharacterized protein YjbI with pentapeptide repeats